VVQIKFDFGWAKWKYRQRCYSGSGARSD